MKAYQRKGLKSAHYRGYRLQELPQARGWLVTGRNIARNVPSRNAGLLVVDIREGVRHG